MGTIRVRTAARLAVVLMELLKQGIVFEVSEGGHEYDEWYDILITGF